MGEAAGQVLTFNFSYITALSKLPECLSWVVWGTSAGNFAWDANITVNDMVAEAGNAADGWTDIEAYVPKSKTEILGNALSGDYVAIGGANLTDNNSDGLRETHVPSSNAAVQSGTSPGQIPTGSSVEAAYLYWGGWARGDGTDTVSVAHDGSNYYDPTVTLTTPGHTDTITAHGTGPDDQINYAPVWSGRGVAITITAGNSTIVGTGSLTGDDVRVGDIIGTSASALNLTGTYTVTAVNVGGNNAKITGIPYPRC